jgi:hypothetical protein
VNPLGEHRLQGSRISLEALRRDLGRLAGKDLFEAGIQRVQRRKATIIASSSMERTVDLQTSSERAKNDAIGPLAEAPEGGFVESTRA